MKIFKENTQKATRREVKGAAHGAPSSISILVILATLDTGPSKTLLLQSRQIPDCPNTTNISLSSNMPSKFKTKHIHVVFVLIAETPANLFFRRGKFMVKNYNFILEIFSFLQKTPSLKSGR